MNKKYILFLLFLIKLVCPSEIINHRMVSNLKKVAPYEVYDIEENPFRDWTDEEIKEMLMPQKYSNYPYTEENRNIKLESLNYPESYDFRTAFPSCNTPIRNQEHCGSCWSFAGALVLQQRFCQKTNGEMNIVLSPQDSISCDKLNDGCSGGVIAKQWVYYEETGIVSESCFPYSSAQGDVEPCINECKNGETWKKYRGEHPLPFYDNLIKDELVKNGPIETGFDVYKDFMNYKAGIYEKMSDEYVGHHAVAIIGYSEENGVKYWICTNSWGTEWGESGYFRIKEKECKIDKAAYTGEAVLE